MTNSTNTDTATHRVSPGELVGLVLLLSALLLGVVLVITGGLKSSLLALAIMALGFPLTLVLVIKSLHGSDCVEGSQ